jgi:DNA-directed RNA polymerase subunit RPC12/RpoP
MTDQSVSILCGTCRVAVEGPTEPQDESAYSCPSCGNSGKFKNVIASVKAFTEEQMSHSFDKMARDTFRGSIVQVASKPTPKRFYPFITDMKL